VSSRAFTVVEANRALRSVETRAGPNRFRARLVESAGSVRPAKVFGESAAQKVCRMRRWKHPSERRTGKRHGPPKLGGHARGRWWKAPDLWPRCVLRGMRGKARSWFARRRTRHLIQGFGRASKRRRVSEDAGEMGLDRRRETRFLIGRHSTGESFGARYPGTRERVGGPEAADVVAGRVI